MKTSLRIGVVGLGTVGAAVVKILQDKTDIIAERAGRAIEIICVSARDKSKDRGFSMDGIEWCEAGCENLTSGKIDVLVELVGGSEGLALDLVQNALENKVSVVTANKAMMAHHGAMLAKLAEDNGVHLKFEAAVAGAIPAIKSIREGLSANDISIVYGILNGTCNYILTEMLETGVDFETILTAAQEAGFAEADPSFDVDGIDTAHKTALLAASAFGMVPKFDAVETKGIRSVTQTDIMYAHDLGYKIKLLGVVKKTDQGVEQSVEPCLVPIDTPLAAVDGSLNAVYVESSFAQESLFVGRGAGGDPTASAVIADLIDIAQDRFVPTFSKPVKDMKALTLADMKVRTTASYLRILVEDKVGVFADIAQILKAHGVSIHSALQLSALDNALVPLVFMLQETTAGTLNDIVDEIKALKTVTETPFTMTIMN